MQTFAKAEEPTAAQVLALANRLMAQKAAPGFGDLKLIGAMMEEEALDALRTYPGRDRDELFELNVRHKIAQEFIADFFGRIEGAIEAARSLPFFEEPGTRQPVITDRIAGSY